MRRLGHKAHAGKGEVGNQDDPESWVASLVYRPGSYVRLR